MMEKEQYDVKVSAAEQEAELVERKGSVIGEAAVLYGNVEAAEKYGYVHRGLKSRHIQFIALGGTIGTGLFLGIGGALASSGPLSVLLGYTITGIAIWAMMNTLGEMATWLPLPGAIPQMCARYFSPAMGFAVGWNQWYTSALTQCAEISAAANIIGYWAPNINPAPWIAMIIVLIIFLNLFAVSIYGEAEFAFASIKIITIVGLLLFAFIVDLGGNPQNDRIGFRYWKHPGAMTETVAGGDAGRFLSFFSTLVYAAFAYGGVEMVAVAAGEAENPRKNIPKAVRRIFWRILFFYVLGALAIGVLVPYDDEFLSRSGTLGSPWVIAIQRFGIRGLPSLINAVIFTSACSSGNAFLFSAARYLFALAQNGQAPRIFLTCTKAGIPIYAVGVTASISLLTFLSCGAGAGVVFDWMLNLTTIGNIFTWISILCAGIRFQSHLKAQNVQRKDMIFESQFQPYTAYAALVFFTIIIIFNGWKVFTKSDGVSNWDVSKFVTAYIGIPIYFGLYGFWAIFVNSKLVKSSEADLWTGKAAIDAEIWPEYQPKNFLERVWAWIA